MLNVQIFWPSRILKCFGLLFNLAAAFYRLAADINESCHPETTDEKEITDDQDTRETYVKPAQELTESM